MAFPRTPDLSEVQATHSCNPFKFIIIGSGMGGGMLARQLINNGQRVLLIEKGGLEYSTHVLNTSRPHFDHTSVDPSIPARDNEVVFQMNRKPYSIAAGSTTEFGGGAINALGGRSLMWSLETPEIDLSKGSLGKRLFPASIVKYLKEQGYARALRVMANSPPSDVKYPQEQSDISTTCKDAVDGARKRLQCALDRYNENSGYRNPADLGRVTNGAGFAPKDKLYYFPQGAYSTVDYLLDRLHSKDENLTVLASHEVVSLRQAGNSVNAIVLRGSDRSTGLSILDTLEANVILCAGTIDTAAIALRSCLSNDSSLIGTGLTDHEIWSTRFWNSDWKPRLSSQENHLPSQENRLPSQENPPPSQENHLPVELTAEINVHKHKALLTVCTQAESFYKHDFATGAKESPEKTGNTLNVMLEFETLLSDSSAVELDVLTSEPVIKLQQKPLEPLDTLPEFKSRLVNLASNLHQSFDFEGPYTGPDMVKGKFGFVAHEVGTMRMGDKPKKSVVDENLRVHGMKDLYVCDLSVFPFSPRANPALTLTALAMRLGDFLDRKAREAAVC